MKSLAKNSLYNIIYQSISLIFPFLSSMYVARIILVDGVGKVAYAQNIVSYFTAIALLGFPAYGIREIARFKDNPIKSNKAFAELFCINAISTTFASVLYILLLISVDSFREELPLYLSAGAIVWLNYANIDWLYQGKEEYGYITVRSLFVKTISLVLLLIFVRNKQDYVVYALISSCGTACNYFFNLIHARKYITYKFNLKSLNIKKHLKPLISLAIITLLSNIYNKIDITMLGALTNDSVVGYYTNAQKIILIIVSCCIAVTTVFMPRLSYYYDRDRESLSNLVNYGVKLLLMIIIPAATGLLLIASDAIILIYGPSFAPAADTLTLLTPMILIRPIGDLLCYQLLISAGKEQVRIYTSLIATVVNIILNYILIPIYQQNGAAFASVVSEVIVNGLLIKHVLSIVNVQISKKFLSQILISTFIMVIGLIAIRYSIHGRLLMVLLSTISGSLLYSAANIILNNEIMISLVDKMKGLCRSTL